MQNQNTAPTNLFVLQIIWAALLVSQVVYTGVGFFLHGSPELITDYISDQTVLILFFVAITAIVAGFIIFNFMLKASPKLNTLDEAKQKYFVPFIIRLVLIESCAIYGLVVSGLVEKNLMLNFSVFSFVAFFLCFPTEAKVREFMKQTTYRRA